MPRPSAAKHDDDDASRTHRWFEPYAWAFGGGAVIGLVYALTARPRGKVFITDSWSYVPADDWWVHAVVVGASLCLAYGGIVLAWLVARLLFRHGLLFTAVGGFLVVGAVFFFGRATLGDETTGGRIAWVVMGMLLGGLGAPMVVADRRPRSRRARS